MARVLIHGDSLACALPAEHEVGPKEAQPEPKIAGRQKRLATAKKKLDAANAASTPARKTPIYEIEDELRPATQSA